MDETLREEIALFRYGVISELVSGPLAPGEAEKALVRLSAREWHIPGSARTRVARSTVRDWAALYRAQGLEGLKPGPRRDLGTSRALPEPVQDLLLALRRERPQAAVDSLIRAVRLSGRVPASVRLAPSTVYRLFAAHGVPAPGGPPSTEPDARAFTFPHVGDLWTSDLMYGPKLLVPGRRDGGQTYLYAFVDDASRLVPYAAFYAFENAACFQDAFKQAALRRGLPRRLYTDNGATFKTRHLEVLCATLSIALIHSRPHHPRGRGKVERFFRGVRKAFLAHLYPEALKDLATLNRLFWAWLEGEYHQTPHDGLQGRTPIDRFLDDAALVRPAPDDLDALMRMKVHRRVAKDRTVRLQGRVYEAPDGLAGQVVDVLFDPYDPALPVHLRRQGEDQEILLRPLDLHVNARLHRHPRPIPPAAEPPPSTGIRYLDLVARRFYGEEE